MKKLFVLILFIFTCSLVYSQVNSNSHYVQGYTNSNGTYVQGHYRTNPNSTINDNYSTSPNVNPYTGKQGTISPEYSSPTIYESPTYESKTYNSTTYETPTYQTYDTW